MTVANTILQQLGGRRFIAMTGSKNFGGTSDSLMFMLARNKSKAQKMKIILTPADTYTVQLWKVNLRAKTVDGICFMTKEVTDVYCDMLQEVFFDLTGLYTSLGTMGRKPVRGPEYEGCTTTCSGDDHSNQCRYSSEGGAQ